MNRCLYDLLHCPERSIRFTKGLPTAFDVVRQRMPKRSPAVGILRGHAIIGFFVAEFGDDCVDVPESGNERSYAVVLCGKKLSVKTRTDNGGIKVLWTSDTEQVEREIKEGYKPEHDILLIKIFWGYDKDSVFYIPLSAQLSVFNYLGRDHYLSSSTGTNNRGIEIRRKAVTLLKSHSDTISISVNWVTDNIKHPEPWAEWSYYWKNME